jgi:predicted nucleic acid-binding protein
MTAILIDTNILVYAHDRGEYEKQKKAIQLLEQLAATGSGRLSVQCLAEFFSAVRKGKTPKLTLSEAIQQVEYLARAWPIFELTSFVILDAVRGVRDHQLSYWDAQLWAIARLNQVPVLFSEDFRDGVVLEGVRFVNPFSPDFVPEAWF